MVIESLKVCSKCGEEKPLFAFNKRHDKPGLRSNCKDCLNGKRREKGHAISDEAREAKRARDRERAKREAGSERRLLAQRKCGHKRYAAIREWRIEQGIFGFSIGQVCWISPIECKVCGKKAVVKGKDKATCSKQCGMRYRGMQHRVTQRVCGCGVVFIGRGKAALCNGCKDQRLRDLRNKNRSRRKHTTRARIYGCMSETVNSLAVHQRDKWRCYLCGCKVVRSTTYKPNQATIDHVIPLSKGGPHTYDNVRTACQSCNSSKSDKIVSSVQLSIFSKG